MSTRDPRVDAYIAKSAEFARPILVYLREVIHEACPEVTETLKWSMPSFEYKGLLCGFAAFKQHCTFGFWKGSLIVDKNGQLIAASGDVEEIDTTSLASLTAGNIAATGGIAKLLRENEFATQFHEGENQNIHIQLVGNRVILVVIFDTKSSLGLVRLRVRKATEELSKIFEDLVNKVQEPGAASPFGEITDDDIDSLFND